MLNFSSKQLKVINDSAMSCLKLALTSTGYGLLDIGYPLDTVTAVTEHLKKSVMSNPSMVAEGNRNKLIVGILYIHCARYLKGLRK